MDVKRRTVIGAAAILLMLVAAGCSGGDEAGGGAGAGPVAAPASFDVSLTEFAISPEMIHAPAGQDLTFSVTNDGTAPHTFAIDRGDELIETPELQPGETQALEVPALDAGEYQTLCTISGHEGLGMTGTLTIMAGGAVAAGASGAAGGTGTHAAMTVEEMLDGHREGVEAFPAETEGSATGRSSRSSRAATRSSGSPPRRSAGRPSPACLSRRWVSTGPSRGPRSVCIPEITCGSS